MNAAKWLYKDQFLRLFPVLLLSALVGCSASSTHLASSGSGSGSGSGSSPTLASIVISPQNPSLRAGATQQLSAQGTDSSGHQTVITASVQWNSSNPAVATIASSGLLTAVSPGTANITASLNGVSATTKLTVVAATATVKAIAISPASPSLAAGATQQLSLTATYSDGSSGALTTGVTWTSSNTLVATVNAQGLVTAIAVGTSTITASAAGLTASAALSVNAAKTLSTIVVAPAAPSLVVGATQQFTATAHYSDNSTATVTSSVQWTSSSPSVATINAAGLASAVAAGSATIAATLNGVSGSASLTVTAPATVTSIAVTPATSTFAAGATQQFTATAQYSNDTSADVTSSATWKSSDTSVATVSAGGLATAENAGSATITASLNGVTGSASVTVSAAAPAGTASILTWHVDNNRSGLNDNEQTLTPANVKPATFGKLFSYLVDGYVYGSPLVLANVTINGAAHNVLYVATEKDTVYAFDADRYGSGAPLWKVSLLHSGDTPLTGAPIQPYEGVTSTPVIDPKTGTLYVVSAQKTSSGGTFRLNALDVATGAQKFGGPVTLNATVAASNSTAVNGVDTLNTSCIQRAALLLANGNVYIGFGGCPAGWMVAYSASTLKQVGVFNSSPHLNGEGKYASAGGVWMGGGGPVADSSGNVYITTGNGPWDGQTAFSDSVLKFGPTPQSGGNGTMQPIDYFTPYVYQYMDCNDADLAAGGLLMIPGTTRLIAGGKTGTMYMVDSQNLLHESANDNGAIQEQVWGEGLTGGGAYQNSCQDSSGTNYANVTSYEIFGTSAYFNGRVYLGVTPTAASSPGGVRAFDYSGTLTPDADTANYQQQGTRGTSPFISADGNSNGIVWMIDQGNPLQNTSGAAPSAATLRAYDAANFPAELYNSSANAADAPGYGIKFSSPVVVNGKAYIATGHDLTKVSNPQGEIDVYGLK
jgi:uncharacterized protein YjdB